MPIVYHNNNASTDSFDDMFVSNADDSIVLSDLIRTGETSRLRRRGAMRMEPASSSIRSSRSSHWRSTHQPDDEVLTWTSVNRRTSRREPRHMPMLEISDDDYEYADSDSEDEMVFSDSFNRAISDQTGQGHHYRTASGQTIEAESSSFDKSHSYTLLCGGPLNDFEIGHRSSSESDYSALARYILPHSASSSHRMTPREYEETNGCGSVVHLGAFPRYHQQQAVWTADSAPSDVVIPLEKIYFEDALEREGLSKKLLRQESCGCLRIGIGCANCGNALGFRLTPCKAYRNYLSSKENPHRNQSFYSSNECNKLHLYTFLRNSVRAQGAEGFPVGKMSPQRARNWSQPRVFAAVPFIPPPPPLISIPSDSEMSDSDEEIVIDFRTPTRILEQFSLSPEPMVIDLDSEYSNSPRDSFVPSLYHHNSNSTHIDRPNNMQDELNEARASWANVVRGVQAASSMENAIDDWREEPAVSPVSTRPPAFRPQRRDAYAPSFEEQFQAWFDARTPLPRSPNLSAPHDDGRQIGILTPPPPAPHELPPSTIDRAFSSSYQTTWGSPTRDDASSSSYWSRPTEGRQWTWTNDWQETDAEAEILDEPQIEWGDGSGMNTDEKSENGETSTALWGV